MKVLIAHNFYKQRGGEDAVVAAETALLQAHGEQVVLYFRNNDTLLDRGFVDLLSVGAKTVWSSDSYRQIKELLAVERPDVAHFHNFFPLISPAAYYACKAARVPVVQTLHNYRLLCPAGTFFRNGAVCESCLGRDVPWPGVANKCYRGSRMASAAVSCMLVAHRFMGTWQHEVDVYVALSEFARQKFMESGLRSHHIVVKPNFVDPDPGKKTPGGDYALFVGRLAEEKGLHALVEAWRRLSLTVPLRIIGEGPMKTELASELRNHRLDAVTLCGYLSHKEVQESMQGARFLVVPSLWFEAFPLVIAEAFACGLPVLCSQLGSLAEIVQDRVTGMHFEPGNAADIAAKAEWAWTHYAEIAEMGRAARAEFEAKYTAEQNYHALIDTYQLATSVYRK